MEALTNDNVIGIAPLIFQYKRSGKYDFIAEIIFHKKSLRYDIRYE